VCVCVCVCVRVCVWQRTATVRAVGSNGLDGLAEKAEVGVVANGLAACVTRMGRRTACAGVCVHPAICAPRVCVWAGTIHECAPSLAEFVDGGDFVAPKATFQKLILPTGCNTLENATSPLPHPSRSRVAWSTLHDSCDMV
jgi:hypothetical protein